MTNPMSASVLDLSEDRGDSGEDDGKCFTCSNYLKAGAIDGVYTIYVWNGEEHVKAQAYCREGRTVFIQRVDGSVSFARGWDDYKAGFGNVASSGNYWLGNDFLHLLTTNCGPQVLRADVTSCNGSTAYEEYSRFKVGDEESLYKVSVGGPSGTAGDGLNGGSPLSGTEQYYGLMDGAVFSTPDADNDEQQEQHCSNRYGGGGWWYRKCFYSQPTGVYQDGCPAYDFKGIYWYAWPGPEYSTSLSGITMSVATA